MPVRLQVFQERCYDNKKMHDAIGKFEFKKKRDGYASESVLPKKDNILRCDGGARPYRARDTWRERESETVTLMLMMWVSTTNIGLVLTFTAVLYTIYLISINRLNGDKANIGLISAQLTYNFAAGIISFCWQLPSKQVVIIHPWKCWEKYVTNFFELFHSVDRLPWDLCEISLTTIV